MKISNKNTDATLPAVEAFEQAVELARTATVEEEIGRKARSAAAHYIGLLELKLTDEAMKGATDQLIELMSPARQLCAQGIFFGLRSVAQWSLPLRWDGKRAFLGEQLGSALLQLLDEEWELDVILDLIDLIGWLGLNDAIQKFYKELQDLQVLSQVGPQIAYALGLTFLFVRDRHGFEDTTINAKIDAVVAWCNLAVELPKEKRLPSASLLLLLSWSGAESATIGLRKFVPSMPRNAMEAMATLGITSCPLALEDKVKYLKQDRLDSLLQLH